MGGRGREGGRELVEVSQCRQWWWQGGVRGEEEHLSAYPIVLSFCRATQFERVEKVFKRQLAVPLIGMCTCMSVCVFPPVPPLRCSSTMLSPSSSLFLLLLPPSLLPLLFPFLPHPSPSFP